MTPSWYDVLDVDAGAGTDEIRASWKSAIADLEPTDRRFRLLNQAAEALLDPDKRAAHDAALAADASEDERAESIEAVPAAAVEPTSEDAETPSASETATPVVGETVPEASYVSLDKATDEPVGVAEPVAAGSRGTSWSPPIWLLAGVFVLVCVLVGLCAWQARIPTDSSVESSTRAAQATAEKAAVAVLSYDYRDLDANEQAASTYLTSSFRKDYDALFTQIKANVDVKPVVTAEVIASGIDRVNRTGDRVSVLVFVNRPTTNAAKTTPEVFQDQVTMQMQKVDGEWLVDDMITTSAAQ